MAASDPWDPPPSVDWVPRLMDEYKILQDKIDKIGAFRFTVKGWSVTITTAVLAAAGAAKIPLYVPIVLLPLVVAFFFLEHEQWEYSLRFGRRAREIEEVLHRVRTERSFDFARFRFPAIASELSRRPRRNGFWRTFRRLVANSFSVNWLIYWVQVFLILIVTGWLIVLSRSTDSRSGNVVIMPFTHSFKLPSWHWPSHPTFGFGRQNGEGLPSK